MVLKGNVATHGLIAFAIVAEVGGSYLKGEHLPDGREADLHPQSN